MATHDKYLKEGVSIAGKERDFDDEETDYVLHATNFKFSPQQIKNLKVYVLDMDESKRFLTLKRGIAKLNANKPLNADEAGSVKDFCLDVLNGSTAKFKALMG